MHREISKTEPATYQIEIGGKNEVLQLVCNQQSAIVLSSATVLVCQQCHALE